MHLVRVLAFFASYFGFNFMATHVASVKKNKWADAISRDNCSAFLSQDAPQV